MLHVICVGPVIKMPNPLPVSKVIVMKFTKDFFYYQLIHAYLVSVNDHIFHPHRGLLGMIFPTVVEVTERGH